MTISNFREVHWKDSDWKRIFKEYLDEETIRGWDENEKNLTQEQMADVFMKAAKDFKAGKLNIDEFTIICGNLYFGAYVQLDFYEKDRIDLRIIEAMREFADPAETIDEEAQKEGIYRVSEDWQKNYLSLLNKYPKMHKTGSQKSLFCVNFSQFLTSKPWL